MDAARTGENRLGTRRLNRSRSVYRPDPAVVLKLARLIEEQRLWCAFNLLSPHFCHFQTHTRAQLVFGVEPRTALSFACSGKKKRRVRMRVCSLPERSRRSYVPVVALVPLEAYWFQQVCKDAFVCRHFELDVVFKGFNVIY